MSCMVKQPPSQNKSCCIDGDERFQSLSDQRQESEVTHDVNCTKKKKNLPQVSFCHAFRHAYLHIHSHTLDFVRFVHAQIYISSLQRKHNMGTINNTLLNVWIMFNSCYTSEVCVYMTGKRFHTIHGTHTHTHTTVPMYTHILFITHISCCESDHREEDYA